MPHRPRLIAAAGALLAALVCSAPAPARIIEVGGPPEATPTCPSSPCLAVSRTTGYQAKVVDSRTTYIVPADGKIVAWTIGARQPDERADRVLPGQLRRPASAGITILRRGKRLYHRVMGQSPVMQLGPYFGQKVQFPLDRSIPVKKGYVVALTVPTWAPALTQLVEDGSSWRASRAKGKCNDTDDQTAQTRMDQRDQYRCLYKARLTYSATLITDPKPNKKPKTEQDR